MYVCTTNKAIENRREEEEVRLKMEKLKGRKMRKEEGREVITHKKEGYKKKKWTEKIQSEKASRAKQ